MPPESSLPETFTLDDVVIDDFDDIGNPRRALREPLLSNDSSLLEEEAGNSHSQPRGLVERHGRNNPWKNRNVILSFVLCMLSGTADSIWSNVVLSAFLLALAGEMRSSHPNTLVGSAEAIEGLFQLMTALPIGYLADFWGKAKVVRSGGFLMLVTIAISLCSLRMVHHEGPKHAYDTMLVALLLWGVVNGISYGPSQALFADSLAKGTRSQMLTYLYTCYLLASATGPIVSIWLLLTISSDAEEWSVDQIYPVFKWGLLLEIPAAIVMFFFSDKATIEDDEDEQGTRQCNGEPLVVPLLVEDGASDEPISASTSAHPRTPVLKKAIVPYVLFASSLITSLGSGASVKYFPLFFKELGLSSAAVQGIFLLVPVSISVYSLAAQKISMRFGRVETTVLCTVIGTSFLYYMTYLTRHVHAHHDAEASLWETNPFIVWWIIAVYLMRTGIMNGTYPLQESILMDSVPSNQRARWKSLESIASFGWTGSALIGGVLSDSHSYQFTFAATATMQLMGGLLLLVLRGLVELEEDSPNEEAASATLGDDQEVTLQQSQFSENPEDNE